LDEVICRAVVSAETGALVGEPSRLGGIGASGARHELNRKEKNATGDYNADERQREQLDHVMGRPLILGRTAR
jgi:hypothetical protein